VGEPGGDSDQGKDDSWGKRGGSAHSPVVRVPASERQTPVPQACGDPFGVSWLDGSDCNDYRGSMVSSCLEEAPR
jgi:hypothetical protein